MRALEPAMRLGTIPEKDYPEYRYEVIFNSYKWDPQVGDHNTISRHAILMAPDTAARLEEWARRLTEETLRLEAALAERPDLAKRLGIPGDIRPALERMTPRDRRRHVRLMRFDFHPTETGWAVSEVNSDVPGGLAEASVMPAIAARHFPGYAPRRHAGDALLNAFRSRVAPGGRIAFVHATSYADDRQVMQFLGDHFEAAGYRAVYAAPDHIRWDGGRAAGVVAGQEGALDGLVRFFPLEWLANLPRSAEWTGFFRAETPSCNHPAAFYTQSKRVPLLWDKLGVEVPAWKSLLPETLDPGDAPAPGDGWIWKPALGRVGENITVPGAATEKEMRLAGKDVRRRPENWVAQRMFRSLPLPAPDGGAYHVCVGVFTVDGECAGFYGRASQSPRIDAQAVDIPVIVGGSRGEEE